MVNFTLFVPYPIQNGGQQFRLASGSCPFIPLHIVGQAQAWGIFHKMLLKLRSLSKPQFFFLLNNAVRILSLKILVQISWLFRPIPICLIFATACQFLFSFDYNICFTFIQPIGRMHNRPSLILSVLHLSVQLCNCRSYFCA